MNRTLTFVLLALIALAIVTPFAAAPNAQIDPFLPDPTLVCEECPPGVVCPAVCRLVTVTPPPAMPPPRIEPPVGGVATDPESLEVAHHRVNIRVESAIARTTVDLKFINRGNRLAEGTFVFPLPDDAAVEDLTLIIDGVAIRGAILDAREARAYYDAIVRQYRDPALLEYIGTRAVQANIFPIPPGEERSITLTYSRPLTVDNGLVLIDYPFDITRLTTRRAVTAAQISVEVSADAPVGAVYSPSHPVAITRSEGSDRDFRADWEATNAAPDRDFVLYYGVDSETINLNLLSYRDSADDDGFFMLLAQPPLQAPAETIAPRDLILVVDQSGSMQGAKWSQAQAAAEYVLSRLNPDDRFNVILFSSGWRVYSRTWESPASAGDAIRWINRQPAEGGTDIHGALMTALGQVQERPTAILFFTDGVPTEGAVQEPTAIVTALTTAAPGNVRLFAFGVGDDVNTILLDSLTRALRGVSTYVRPFERVDEQVAAFYAKISAPVLTDVTLTIDGVTVETLYPAVLPDLYAGTQQIIVGRYRSGAEDVRITLSGRVGGEMVSYTYDGIAFRDRAGGDPAIAQTWATRRIGDLLNSIRINGESPELIDSIVSLSIRYGIITPYTSFLIDENDILTQIGRSEAARSLRDRNLGEMSVGSAAVGAADLFADMESASAPIPQSRQVQVQPMATMSAAAAPARRFPLTSGAVAPAQPPAQPPARPAETLRTVADKTFVLRAGVWTDTTFDPDVMTTIERVIFLSDAYFDLLAREPRLAPYFAIGDRVIVLIDGVAYEVTT